MKNFIILTTLFFSQLNFSQKDFSYGVKFGGNFNTNPELTRNRTNYFGGAYFNLYLSDEFNLQIEALYSTNVTIIEFDSVEGKTFINFGPQDYEVKQKVLLFPILAQFNLNKNFFAEIGPQLNYVIEGKLNYKEDDPTDFGQEITTEMNSEVNFALALGFGYNITENVKLSIRDFLVVERNENIINLGIAVQL